MRIDYILRNLNTFGGAEEQTASLAELLKAQGHDVSVCLIQAVTPENQYVKRLQAAGVPICQWPVWLSRLSGDWDTREAILRRLVGWLAPLIAIGASLLTLVSSRPRNRARESVEGRLRTLVGRLIDPGREKQLFRLLLTWRYYRRRPDVLHVRGYGAGLDFVLRWAHGRNLATVYQEHSTPDLTPRRWRGLPTGLNMATVVVAVSETSAQALRRLCGVTRPIEVIPPIVTLNVQKTKTERVSGQDGHVVHILTIARLSEEKGLSYLIKAAGRVVAARPSVCFVIYGEGPLRESLEAQIDAAHLRRQVYLAGSFTRSELSAIMSTADVFVLPSITEGFPLSVIEAMAWGLPIVATAVGGVPELVEDGVTALLCPPRDVNALAQAILTLVNDPVRSRALGAAARNAYHSSQLKPECVAARFAEVYSKALQMRECHRRERS